MQKKIVIVDDDPDFTEVASAIVSAAGYEVISVESAADAEAVIARENPELAIVDLMMEELDAGFVLCYHIKKNTPSLPVIMISAVGSEAGMAFDAATPEEQSWIKADVFLQKPIRGETLLKEIKRLLS